MYVKLFTSIYQGTLRGNSHGLLVFTNLLAHCDCNGEVDVHPKAIAEEVGLTVEEVRSALVELESSDPDSRSPENDGRRIIPMDESRNWGWIVTNYAKYRKIRNEDDRKEQNRESQQRWRDRNKPPSATVSQGKPRSAQAEAEAISRRNKNTPDGVSDSVWQDFLKIRKAKKSPMNDTALKGIVVEAEKAGITLQKALEHCCTRGWAGFKASWLDGEKVAYVAPITVPGRQGVDPALAKAIADGLKATAPSAEIREKMNQLRRTA